MNSITSLNTVNFLFSLAINPENGETVVSIKGKTAEGKNLLRIKKLGKDNSLSMARQDVFNYVDSFEAKAALLASI